jgi:excisionase family DNA binding protein
MPDRAPLALLLAQAERRLTDRVIALGERLDAGEDVWDAYTTAVATLNALVPAERRALMTTAEMAQHLQVSQKTIRKLGKTKKLESIRLGRRGSAAIRWRSA